MPFFNIAHTYRERKQIILFWEEMRKEAEKIRDEYDSYYEEIYNKKFYKKIREKIREKRPDFLEPFP